MATRNITIKPIKKPARLKSGFATTAQVDRSICCLGPDAASLDVLHAVLAVATDRNYLDMTRRSLIDNGVVQAVRRQNTPALLTWFMEAVSFQGVSDAAASG